jgi:hypothetical protein
VPARFPCTRKRARIALCYFVLVRTVHCNLFWIYPCRCIFQGLYPSGQLLHCISATFFHHVPFRVWCASLSLSLSKISNMVCPTWFITVQWAALLDIDEYVSLNKGSGGQKLESERAADRFDKLNGNGENAILFSWLNFLVKNSSRSLTRSVMRHRMPVLRDPSDKSVNCYKWPPQDLNGKAALKCDEGLGFTIHRAVQLPPKASMDAWSRDIFVLSPDLRAWHPRLRSSQGKCEHIVDTT